MPGCSSISPATSLLLLLLTSSSLSFQNPARAAAPSGEVLRYTAEWRMVHAGNVRLSWAGRPAASGWQADLSVRSAGLVSKFYRVDNLYTALVDAQFCADSYLLTAREGTRERETKVTYDSEHRKATSLERDLKKGTTVSAREIDIPACVHDVIGGLYQLRTMRVEPGRSVQIPVSDGRKSVLARVDAQQRETVRTPAGSFRAIRYEAFLFNDVLYRRKGRLFVWLTDDERRLPVQVRVRLPFYIGTVTLQLEKAESS